MDRRRYQKLAAWALGYTLLVVIWGAFVRATGSGAGCGDHWPLCNGVVIPRAPRLETLIELSHRVTAGLSIGFGVAVAFFAFRVFPKGDRVRKAALTSCLLVMGEALIGAGIVLYKLVAHDESMARAMSMPLHLVNTFFLMGALAMTTWWARGRSPKPLVLRGQGVVGIVILLALISILLVATSGALAALGDTLFPPTSVAGAIIQDLSPSANVLVRLRLLHPFFALLAALATTVAATVARTLRPNPETSLLSRLAIVLVFSQIGAGLLNIALLAPVAMQLVHLALAELTWIAIVLLGVSAFSAEKSGSALDAAVHHVEERAGA
ncbi:MAG: COX15/CtaA family protein [Polyangiaceae bacterium]